MTELPEPLTPPECDLRHYDWMPLTITVLKGSRSWMKCKRNPALAFYLINLWTASWHQVPAASLENDDEYLCDVAQCDPKLWLKVRETVMAGFEECADGRLYHQYVAREANKAWLLLLSQRARTEAATAARKAKHSTVANGSGPTSPPIDGNVMNDVTSNVTSNDTVSATSSSTSTLRSPPDQTRPDQTKKERTCPSDTAQPSAAPLEPPDLKTQVWRDGKRIVSSLTGQPEREAGAFVGRMAGIMKQDFSGMLAIFREAERLKPLDPSAWMMAAAQSRTKQAAIGLTPRQQKIRRAAGISDDGPPIIDGTFFTEGGRFLQ